VIGQELRKRTYNRKNEFATSFPFPAVDAMILEIISENKANVMIGGAAEFRRVPLTSGSVVFQFQTADRAVTGGGIPLGSIFISMLDDRTTYIYSNVSTHISSPSDSIQRLLNDIVLVTLDELERRLDHGQNLLAVKRQQIPDGRPSINAEFLANLKSIPKRGSHTSYAEDNWAWDEVNVKKRPRAEVRKEWMQRLSQGRKLQDPPGSFRHAINRKRKGKREAER
jgi:hypothetical protein